MRDAKEEKKQERGATPLLLQDCDRRLSRALANKPDSRLHAREAAQAIANARKVK